MDDLVGVHNCDPGEQNESNGTRKFDQLCVVNLDTDVCITPQTDVLALDSQTNNSMGFDPMVEVEARVLVMNQNVSELMLVPKIVEGFDPMVEVEFRVAPCLQILSAQATSKRKPRGRPKKAACSLPVPLYVPSTPSKSLMEAKETWNIAKSLGVRALNEGEVIAELRKSKRIMALEEDDPIEG